MKSNLGKGLLVFIIGVGFGIIGTRRYMGPQMRDLEDELEEYYQANKKSPNKNGDDNGEKICNDESVATNEVGHDGYIVQDQSNRVPVLNTDKYKKLAKQYGNYEQTESDKERMEHLDKVGIGHDRDEYPGVITMEEFLEDSIYDKLTIYYYEDDDTLADEEGACIADVASIIGDDALNSFGEGSEDPEVVYVRNPMLGIDYEVIRLSKSYAKEVLGFKDDDQDGIRVTSKGRDIDG